MISGVHYYTGQLFDIETITRVAHEQVFICTIYWISFCVFRVVVSAGIWHMLWAMYH
jgi:kynureninase